MSEITHVDMLQAKASAPTSAQNPDALEVVEGRQRENLQGWIPALATESEIFAALEKAFDYRGDVTITRKDGSKVEGYLFDRKKGASLTSSLVRVMPAPDANGVTHKIAVAYSDIAALAFSGRDTAAGKSFEAWVKKYAEKKAAGETNIALHPESLD